ncbi:MAG TPA: methionine--tRNA ligase, partial [Ktedonobacteraceae bacterium]|nr:methionine--tRNA ligase [Ktedonobacteraceae bacterium]
PADTFARYHRLAGNKVLMVSGSDEHGTPILVDSEREGISPRKFVERYHHQILEVWERLGMSWDLYTETGTENHYRITQDFFLTLYDKGYIFKDTMESPYCPTDRRFLPDRYVEGTCPHCGYPSARGDQCDNCGRTLDPVDLIDPRCRLCGSKDSKLEIRPTEHFFLDLPKLQEPLEQWLNDGKDFWRPNTIGFVHNWLREGLRPRAITRDLDWGVPIPLEGYEDKRIYVWFDAVIGYFSASVEWAERQGTPEAWKTWWVPGQTNPPVKSYYFIGKDNIPFHALIWPAMLMGYGNRNLPYDVPANEFMTMSGAKASSSRGNVIWTKDVLDRYGADTLRYYLSVTAPEGRDTDFTYEELIRRNNDELVATYGNAVHRTLTFLQSRFDGVVPHPQALREADREILAEVDRGFTLVGHNIANCHLKDGIHAAMAVARAANRYLDEQAPWKQIKQDREAAGTTLYVMLQVLSGLHLLFWPYLPFSSEKLHHYLGFEGDARTAHWHPTEVPEGTRLPVPAPLFPKLEEVAVV